MASENGIPVEDEIVMVENKDTDQAAFEQQKEVQQSDKSINTMHEDTEVSENAVKPQNLDLAAQKPGENEANVEDNANLEDKANVENEANVEDSKPLKSTKKSSTLESSSAKKNKLAKDKPELKCSGTFSRSPRFISQSTSFPSRGPRADVIKKTLGDISKNGAKNVMVDGVKSKASPSKAAGVSAKHVNFAHVAGAKHTTAAKADESPSSAVCRSGNESTKSRKAVMPKKIDEDARSTGTATSTPRGWRSSNGSGFSFKLDERIEKRKEFFSKLDEKKQAKEIQKSNLQAKSKENQDEEIKKLRKSLTFKATPMPVFYKEPPLKAELKKIPTTRPLSPKLGRKKSSNTDTATTPTGKGTGSYSSNEKSSSAKRQSRPKDSVVSRKPITNSQPKLQSRNTSAKAKTETKPGTPKPMKLESSDTEKHNAENPETVKENAENLETEKDNAENQETQKENAENLETENKPEEKLIQTLNSPKQEDSAVPEKNSAENEGTPISVTVLNEAAVGA